MIFKRKAEEALNKFDIENQKSLLIAEGGCGVGKTILITDHVRKNYEGCLYIDVRADSSFISFASNNTDKSLKMLLYAFFNIETDSELFIPIIIDNFDSDRNIGRLIYDYINELPTIKEAVPKLFLTCNYFDKALIKVDDYRSYLEHIILFPMTFEEFLIALEHEWYAEIIRGHFISRRKIPDMLHRELLDLFEIYLNTGGMPAVIEEYIRLENTRFLTGKRKAIFDLFRCNAGRLCCTTDEYTSVQSEGIIDAVATTFIKKNRKFMYTTIRRGITEKMYRGCIDYLCRNHYLIKQNRILTVDNEITADNGSMRLYFNDFGLINNTANEILFSLTTEPIYKKALIENYIIQMLHANGIQSYYWESGTGASLDFCILSKNQVIPVEIKLPEFRNAVSISNYIKNNNTELCIKISLNNYSFNEKQWNIPIYSVGFIDIT